MLNFIQIVLVFIDLQQGIFGFGCEFYVVVDVVQCVVVLMVYFCEYVVLVVCVKVGWLDGFLELLWQIIDQLVLMLLGGLLVYWWDDFVGLLIQVGDVVIVKWQWNVFYGIELDLQLCWCGIMMLVLGGIVSYIGVEGMVCVVWEWGYQFWIVEDLCSVLLVEFYQVLFKFVMLWFGYVWLSMDVVFG